MGSLLIKYFTLFIKKIHVQQIDFVPYVALVEKKAEKFH